MGLSNPRLWRGERLHHHGDVVCHVVCAFCAVLSGLRHSSYVDKYHKVRVMGVTTPPPPARTIAKVVQVLMVLLPMSDTSNASGRGIRNGDKLLRFMVARLILHTKHNAS